MKNKILAIVTALAVIGIACMSVLATDIQTVSMKANNTSCVGQDMQGGSWLLLQPEGAIAQIDVNPEKILQAQFQAASVEKHGDNYLVTVPGKLDPKLTDDLGYPGAKLVERNDTTKVTIVAAPESVITNYLKKNLDADVNVVDVGPVKYEIRTNVTRESLNAILAPVGGNVPVGAETFVEGVTADTLDETKKILDYKLYHLGLKDVKIRLVGSQYLLIDTPGMDAATAEDVVAKQGRFEIRIQTHDNETEHVLYGDSVESLETPKVDRQGGWGVPFTLSEEGAKIFQKAAIDVGATKNPEAHSISMYLDEDEIFVAPLSAELADSLEKTPLRILEARVGSGDAASQKAKWLYIYLKVGALPVNVRVIEHGCLDPNMALDAQVLGLQTAVGEKNGNYVDSLIKDLEDDNSTIRENAAFYLGMISNNRTVDPLIQALKDNDSAVRMNAAFSLGRIKDDRTIEPLIQALKDNDSDVRMNAASALGNIKDDRVIEPLIQALNDDNYYVRMNAASALAEINDTRAVEPLIQALKDNDYHVRMNAARALGEINDTRAVVPLIQALKDSDSDVQLYAAKALGKIKD